MARKRAAAGDVWQQGNAPDPLRDFVLGELSSDARLFYHLFATARARFLPQSDPFRQHSQRVLRDQLNDVLRKLRVDGLIAFDESHHYVLSEVRKQPAFTYRIGEKDGQEHVELFIGVEPVPLRGQEDVHLLLSALCTKPKIRLTGSEAKHQYKIANPSRACGLIRKALGTAMPNAASWLEPNPIAWASGHAPRKRPG